LLLLSLLLLTLSCSTSIWCCTPATCSGFKVSVDVNSAPHSKHTASRTSWLNTRGRIRSVPVNFRWNWQRMKIVR
jgi:hypothetical protein